MTFIDGITLLNTVVDNHLALRISVAFVLMMLTISIIYFISCVIISFEERDWLPFSLLIVLTVFIFTVAIVFGKEFIDLHTPTTKYQVLIEDTVSFNNVMENYDIISQDGDIWTIEVKE